MYVYIFEWAANPYREPNWTIGDHAASDRLLAWQSAYWVIKVRGNAQRPGSCE